MRPFFKDSLARAFEIDETDETAIAPTSGGMQTDTRHLDADKKYLLTEADRLAIEKERKVDEAVEAAFYSLMREGRSS